MHGAEVLSLPFRSFRGILNDIDLRYDVLENLKL